MVKYWVAVDEGALCLVVTGILKVREDRIEKMDTLL